MNPEIIANTNSIHDSLATVGAQQTKASGSDPVAGGLTRTDPLTRFLWGLLVFSLPFTDVMFPKSARGFGQPSSYLTLVVWVLVLLRILHGKEKLRFLKNKSLLLMLLFWLVAGISIAQSSQAPLSPWLHTIPWISGVKQFVELSVALSVGFFTVFFVRSWRDFRFAMTWYFAGWIGSVLAQALDFAAYFIPGSPSLQAANDLIHHTPWWQFIGPFPRLRLSTAEGSWASDYLICVIPFFVLRAYYWKSRAWNVLNSLVSVLVLFATMSFGGLAVFLGQAALMSRVLGKRALGFLMLAGAAPLLLAVVISPTYVTWVWNRAVGAFVYGSESDDASVRLRAALAEASWAAFKEHPWLGVGLGVSPYYVPGNVPVWAVRDPYVKGFANSFEGSNLCNLDSQVLSETGLIGTGLFALLLSTMLLGTFKAYRQATEGWKRSVHAAILVSLLGQIVHYTSMNTFHFHYWTFIWGLSIFARRSSTHQKDTVLLPVRRTTGHSLEAAVRSGSWARGVS